MKKIKIKGKLRIQILCSPIYWFSSINPLICGLPCWAFRFNWSWNIIFYKWFSFRKINTNTFLLSPRLIWVLTKPTIRPPIPPLPTQLHITFFGLKLKVGQKLDFFTPMLCHWFCPNEKISPILFWSFYVLFALFYYLSQSVRLTYDCHV